MSLSLDFRTIADPQGHAPHLRLKGDWLLCLVSDGRHTGIGEATHSGDDDRCRSVMQRLFDRHVRELPLEIEYLWELEDGPFARVPSFLAATAVSALDQALYDLLARRQGLPVWQLFTNRPHREKVELYVTLNRCIAERSLDGYRAVVAEAAERGFRHVKVAPFDAVEPGTDDQLDRAAQGLEILRALREEFSDVALRVDCHARFTSETMLELLPELDRLGLYWLEEPLPMGPEYPLLKRLIDARLAGGELYFGPDGFRQIIQGQWVDVIMPDVKHAGGFGPLLKICTLAAEEGLEVSPHNPSGPVSTLASACAAAIWPNVTSLELPFDRAGRRDAFGEPIVDGHLALPEGPGWGIEIEQLVAAPRRDVSL